MFDIINPKERREHKSNGNKQASRVEQREEQASRSSGINGFPEDAPNLFDERIYPIGAEEKKEGINEDGNTDTVHNAQDQRTEAA